MLLARLLLTRVLARLVLARLLLACLLLARLLLACLLLACLLLVRLGFVHLLLARLLLARLLGAARIEAFLDLCDTHDVPAEAAVTLVRALDRKFPAAGPAALCDALEVLFPSWARFDDWMGAVALLRAVPTQRTLPIAAFADLVAGWLAGRDDLFDAVADLTRLEGGGRHPVAEALRLLAATAVGDA